MQTVNGSTVTLQDGSSFSVAGQTAITYQAPGTAADIKPGQLVAVTATPQQDNSTLLASMIRVFLPSGSFDEHQSPQGDGTLMTNATVATVQGNGFTVTFPGGGAQVTVAPDAQIQIQTNGSLANIKPGTSVSASVLDGVAQAVSIE